MGALEKTTLLIAQPASEIAFDTGDSSVASDSLAGFVVSSTNVIWLLGSSQHSVPVDPLCPNVALEHPEPNCPLFSIHPSPQPFLRPSVWLVIIAAAVSARKTRESGLAKYARKRATSSTPDRAPPHGEPRLRQ